ncbi:MAG: SoxR reducing system RseC family protein [Pseudomonadota bacterium]
MTRVDGDQVTLRVERQRMCRACLDGRGCGAGLLAIGRDGPRNITVHRDDQSVRAGDQVRLACARSAVLRGALVGYGLPLAGLLLGASLAASVLGEGYSAIAGLIGLASGVSLAHWMSVRRASRRVFILVS